MASIIIPRRHYAQPQGRIALDFSHPSVTGLVLAESRAELSSPLVGPSPSTNTVSASTTTIGAGVGRTFASEGHEYPFGPLSEEWTFATLAVLSTARSALLSQSRPSDGVRAQSFLLANTNSVYGTTAGMLALGSGSTSGTTSMFTAAGAIDAHPRLYAGTHATNGDERLYRDGIVLAERNNPASIGGGVPRVRVEGIHSYTGWHSGSHIHILDLVWARRIDAAEMGELGANPWQLFRADPIRIYSLPSGPISPTITGITASLVTSSSARITLGVTR